MAVIRQRQQVFTKPIGVTRMNTGEAELWETVKQGADRISSLAFQENQILAEEAGTEAGLDAPMREVLGVNPETGKVEPASAPEGFGSIARRAYQKVVDARFMDEADSKVRLKAKELASKYKRSPTEFANQMSNFIAESAEKTAGGKYKNIILDNGKKYLAEMQINLMDQARSRARVREAELANYNLLEGISYARDAAEQGDYGLATELSQQQMQKAQALYDAELISLSELITHQTNYKTSVAQGVIQNVFTRISDLYEGSTVRKDFMLSLRTGGADGNLPPLSENQEPIWDDVKRKLIKPFTRNELISIRAMLLPRMLTDKEFGKEAHLAIFRHSDWKMSPEQRWEMGKETASLDDTRKRNRAYLDDTNVIDVLRFAELLDSRKSTIEAMQVQKLEADLAIRQVNEARRRQLDAIKETQAFDGEARQYLENALETRPTDNLTFGGKHNALLAAANGLTKEVLKKQNVFEERFKQGEKGYSDTKLKSDSKEVQRSALHALLDLSLVDGNSEKVLNALNGGSLGGLTTVQVAVVQGIRNNSDILISGDMNHVNEYVGANKKRVFEDQQQNILARQAATLGNNALNSASTMGWQDAYELFISESTRLGLQEGKLSGPEFRIQQAMIRKAWAKSIVDTHYSQMTVTELTDLRTAVAARKIDSNASPYSQRVAEQINGIAREDLNVEAITGHIDTLKNAKVIENNKKQAAKVVSNRLLIGNMGGTKVEHAETALAADKAVILNVLGLEAGDADDPAVISNAISEALLLPESAEDFGIIGAIPDAARATDASLIKHQVRLNIKRGIISQGFINNLKGIASGVQGSYSNQEIKTTMDQFANFAFDKNADGTDRNMLAQFEDLIGKDTLSRLEAVYTISKAIGSDNLSEIFNKLEDNSFDSAFQQMKSDKLKSGYTFLTNSVYFEADQFSSEALRVLAPTADYLYNVHNGNLESVKGSILDIYKSRFIKTEGYVLDVSHSEEDRSLYALSHHLPKDDSEDSSPLDAFIKHVEFTLSEIPRINSKTGFPLPSYTFGITGVPKMGEAFIVPLEKSNDGAVYYMLMEQDINSVKRPIFKDGLPVYFSTTESYLEPSKLAFKAKSDLIGTATEATEVQIQRRRSQQISGDVRTQEQSPFGGGPGSISDIPLMTPSERMSLEGANQ